MHLITSVVLSQLVQSHGNMDPIAAFQKVQVAAAKAVKETKDLFSHSLLAEDSTEKHDLSKKGVSLLQVKCAILLRYNANLMRLALARVRGDSIDKLAENLVRDSVALSKLRPLEKKIQHHIEHLLSTSTKHESDAATVDVAALQNHLRPNPSAVVVHENGDAGADTNGDAEQDTADKSDAKESSGIYRPPRLAEVVYGNDRSRRAEREEERKKGRATRALRIDGVRELLAEVRGLPEEVMTGGADVEAPVVTGETRRLMRNERDRAEYEEENFTRLAISKKDKKKRQSLAQAAHSAQLGGDEVQSLAAIADRVLEKRTDKANGQGKDASRNSKKRKRRSRNDSASEDFKQRKLDEALQRM